jgi:hypothetical protein
VSKRSLLTWAVRSTEALLCRPGRLYCLRRDLTRVWRQPIATFTQTARGQWASGIPEATVLAMGIRGGLLIFG